MKKFKYNLEKLMKLREFEEYTEKVKLGRINEEREMIKEKINELKESINFMFLSQEKEMKNVIKAQNLFMYEYFCRSYRHHILDLEEKLKNKDIEYKKQLDQYMDKKNKVKILENLKEIKYKDYKKETMYKEEVNISSIINSRYAIGKNE